MTPKFVEGLVNYLTREGLLRPGMRGVAIRKLIEQYEVKEPVPELAPEVEVEVTTTTRLADPGPAPEWD